MQFSNIKYYITFLFLLFVGNAHPQTLIDCVIAVVNGQAITQSELENEFRIKAILGEPYLQKPTTAQKLARLEDIIARKFVLQEAERIRIRGTDQKKHVADRIMEIRAKYTTETEFQRVLQKHALEIETLEVWIRDQLIYTLFFRRKFVNLINTEEIEELAIKYFQTYKTTFIVPPSVTFWSVLINVPPNPSQQEKEAAKRLAQLLNSRLQQGETFETIKQAYEGQQNVRFNLLTLTTDTPLGSIVTQLQPTERKGPLFFPEGYRIFELVRKIPTRQKQYSEVKDSILERIRQNRAKIEFEKWLTKQKERELWYILDATLTERSRAETKNVK